MNARFLKSRPWLSWVLWPTIALGMLVVFLPTILGSDWVYRPLLKRLEAGDFQLHVGSVRLRWLSPIVLRDIDLREADGGPLLRVEQVSTDRGLLLALLSGRRMGCLTVSKPEIQIELLTEGSNLERLIRALDERAKQQAMPSRGPNAPPAVDLDLEIRDLSVRVDKADSRQPLVVVPPADLSLKYRAIDLESRLLIEPAHLLREVTLTPELMKLGLDHALPLLAKSAWFQGSISLSTGPIEIPLAETSQVQGAATVTLHQVSSGPTEAVVLDILDLIASIRGSPAGHELVFVDGTQVDIDFGQRQVSHRGLKFGLPKIDPRLQLGSSGTVRLEDHRLDLLVDFPVPLAQLARREEVRELGVPTVSLPIRGTLDKPEVDWRAMRGQGAEVLAMIGERLGEDAPRAKAVVGTLEGLTAGDADQFIQSAVGLLRGLREARRASAAGTGESLPGEPAEASAAETRSKRPVLDALKGILQGGRAASTAEK